MPRTASVANASKQLKMIDLFAGAGGLSEGLREAGFKSLYANELVATYAQTFAANHPDALVDSDDIRGVDAAEVRRRLKLRRGELDLIAGGPPCQGFSINAPKRRSEDRRNHLFREYLRFVEEFHPRAVLIENVPGLVSFEGGATLEAILDSLRGLGYAADVQILYAPLFGVPQTRWRTIILGLRDGTNPLEAFPEPVHSAPMRVNFTSKFAGRNIVAMPRSLELPSHTTVQEALGDLPILRNGEEGDKTKPYRMPPMNDYQRVLRAGSEGVTIMKRLVSERLTWNACGTSPLEETGRIFRLSFCLRE